MKSQLINFQKFKAFKNWLFIKNCPPAGRLKIGYFVIGLLVFIGSICSIGIIRAYGQEALSFSITPPNIKINIAPGEKAQGAIIVINNSQDPLTFKAFSQDYIVKDTKGTPLLIDSLSNRFSASSWLEIVPNTFTVEPHNRQEINYYLQVPKDAAAGGHYTAILFKPLSALGIKGTKAIIETQLGSLMYIKVSGQIKEKAQISKFFINPFQENAPIKIKAEIKNLGDLDIKPLGNIVVTDFLGRTIQTEKLNEYNIFPQASRVYENTIVKKIMLGRFKATLLASYGEKNNLPLISTVYFWVIPWRIFTLIILMGIATILGIMYLKKSK